MAFANLNIRKETSSFLPFIVFAIAGLLIALVLILYYEYKNQIEQLYFIGSIYLALTLGAMFFSWGKRRSSFQNMLQYTSKNDSAIK